MPRGRKKSTSQRQRRYGVVLDGGRLTAVTTENGQAIEVETVDQPDNLAALESWLAKARPRESVTVTVLSDHEEFCDVEIPSTTPDDRLTVALEQQASEKFRKDQGAFTIAAQLDQRSGAPRRTARVFGVPEDQMVDLWGVSRSNPNVHFTLPTMAFSVDGLHLAVYYSTSRLVSVQGGIVRASWRLESGRAPSTNGHTPQAEVQAWAEGLADEVKMVFTDWTRKSLALAGNNVLYITGPCAIDTALFHSLSARGFTPQYDRVSSVIDMAPLMYADHNRVNVAIRAGLAAATAVADLGEVGELVRPGHAATSRTAKRRSRASDDVSPGLKQALPVIAVLAIAVIVLGYLVPTEWGSRTLSSAQSTHTTAEATLSKLGPEVQLYEYNQQLSVAQAAASDVDWGTIVPAVMATAPSGVTFEDLSLVASGSSIDVTAQIAANPPSDLPTWISSLQGQSIEATATGTCIQGVAAAAPPAAASSTAGSTTSSASSSSGSADTPVCAAGSTSGSSSSSSQGSGASTGSAPSGSALSTLTFTVPRSFK
jgi:hypothetical protein